jgi:hypothetical protein
MKLKIESGDDVNHLFKNANSKTTASQQSVRRRWGFCRIFGVWFWLLVYTAYRRYLVPPAHVPQAVSLLVFQITHG